MNFASFSEEFPRLLGTEKAEKSSKKTENFSERKLFVCDSGLIRIRYQIKQEGTKVLKKKIQKTMQ